MEADSGRAGYDRSQRPGRLRDGPAGRFRPDRPPPVDCSRHGAHGRHQLTAPSAALRNPFISDAAAPQVPTHRPRPHVSPPPPFVFVPFVFSLMLFSSSYIDRVAICAVFQPLTGSYVAGTCFIFVFTWFPPRLERRRNRFLASNQY